MNVVGVDSDLNSLWVQLFIWIAQLRRHQRNTIARDDHHLPGWEWVYTMYSSSRGWVTIDSGDMDRCGRCCHNNETLPIHACSPYHCIALHYMLYSKSVTVGTWTGVDAATTMKRNSLPIYAFYVRTIAFYICVAFDMLHSKSGTKWKQEAHQRNTSGGCDWAVIQCIALHYNAMPCDATCCPSSVWCYFLHGISNLGCIFLPA